MPRVGAEVELRTLTECLYSHPAETLSDLDTVRSLFPDLRLYRDYYCFPNREKKKLVYLGGTVPVHYEGREYNIPVCVWLHETHPVSRPRCYVCPSVSMVINPSCPCVDASGNVSLDGLRNWTPGVSSLSLLVSEMTQAFQRDTPLYARCPAAGVEDTPLYARCPAAGVEDTPLYARCPAAGSVTSSSSSSSSSPSHRLPPSSTHQPGQKGLIPASMLAF